MIGLILWMAIALSVAGGVWAWKLTDLKGRVLVIAFAVALAILQWALYKFSAAILVTRDNNLNDPKALLLAMPFVLSVGSSLATRWIRPLSDVFAFLLWIALIEAVINWVVIGCLHFVGRGACT